MNPVVNTIAYALISVTVIIAMIIETNRRVKCVQPDKSENGVDAVRYRYSGTVVVCVLVLATISAFCGYVISNNAISVIADIELGICYMAALAATVIDLKTNTIPNFIPVVLVLLRLAILVYEFVCSESAMSYLVSSLVGCFLCAVLLIIGNKISKGGIGGGDIKLLSCIGFMCGVYVVFSALLISLIACIIVSAILLALKKRTSKDRLPFAPFIYLGFTLVCLFTLY